MISMDDAQDRILGGLAPLPAERVTLGGALGRVLAEDVVARRALPPEANSAMDGYAVRAADTVKAPVVLKVVGVVPAGGHGTRPLGEGEAYRIFTGAPIPPGADAVVMQEATKAGEGAVEVLEAVEAGHHVRAAGDDVAEGTALLAAGASLGPAELGVLAAQGRTLLRVHRRPVVAILGSGDELVEPDGEVTGGRIVSSNTDALAAACVEAGAIPRLLGNAADTEAAIGALVDAAAGADVVVTIGGVSVGDRDLVRPVLEAKGMEQVFWKVAVKPGKPLLHGRLDGRPVFGLPGNPVSALTAFLVFVRPALRALAGHRAVHLPRLPATLAEGAPAAHGRTNLVYVRLTRGDGGLLATPIPRQASHRMTGTLGANGLLAVPPDAPIPAGARVEVLVHRLPGEPHGR